MSEDNFCRLCAYKCIDYICLYDENGYHNEFYEITFHYFQPLFARLEKGNHHNILCAKCWRHIYDFHNFREFVFQIQTKLIENQKHVEYVNTSLLERPKTSSDPSVDGHIDVDISVKRDIECISFADSESMDLYDEMPSLKTNEIEANNRRRPSQEVESYAISDDSEEEFEDPVGVFVGGDFNANEEEYDISLSEMEEIDAKISTNDDVSLKSEYLKETKAMSIEDKSKTRPIENVEPYLLTENNVNSNIKSITTKVSVGCRFTHKTALQDMINGADPDYRPSITKMKGVKRKRYRSQNPILKLATSHVRRTVDESDEHIAQWLPTIVCVVCQESITTFTLLKEHFRQNHPSAEFYVSCCQRKIYYRCLLEEHVSLHLDPNTFKCKLCGKRFSSRANLCSHGNTPCSGLDKFKDVIYKSRLSGMQ